MNVAELNREQNASQERVRTKHHEAAPWSSCNETHAGAKTTQHPWYLTEQHSKSCGVWTRAAEWKRQDLAESDASNPMRKFSFCLLAEYCIRHDRKSVNKLLSQRSKKRSSLLTLVSIQTCMTFSLQWGWVTYHFELFFYINVSV